ncbi:class III lanthionine synthetase LanKC [Saccharopolyspora cebuensis]|uniref:class III lanthionine synthetase LanKC n=1 Tax=Saccharopolyspora cebuensis TaxID=418759 RepID=UPI0031EB87B8
MDQRYDAYCAADRYFYDVPRAVGPADDFSCSVPAGWSVAEWDGWRGLRPDGVVLPEQGWKIHVSTTMAEARRAVEVVARYCLRHRLAFKHLRGPSVLLVRNSKTAPREASGKLLTLYPTGTEQLEHALEHLSADLRGVRGPYVLSDLRYGDGPLYVRYGGFAVRWVERDGTPVPAIRRPDGVLVPDERAPGFHLPDWVELPACLEPSARARDADAPFPCTVERPLHFSNGGGVYLAARKRDGLEVVLKEARPHAGLDRDGTDAVTRLDREHRALTALAGVPGVPRVHDRFSVWEHHYLAMQRMPGSKLGPWLARHFPGTRADSTAAALTAYRDRALRILEQVERLLAEVHRRGLVFGDLHPPNVLVDEDDTVSLVDFELAFPIGEPVRPALGAPGFRAPPGRTGVEIDEHALATLKLWLFAPLAPLHELDPAVARDHAWRVTRRFALPDDYGAGVLRTLRRPTSPPAPTVFDRRDWRAAQDSTAAALLASATPHRADRLFPGDIEQFATGGATFAHGAAGVLHALLATGRDPRPEHERWLLDTARRTPPSRPGLHDGAHGIAYVLAELGHAQPALDLVEQHTPPAVTDHGLARGLSGVGVNLLHFGRTHHEDGLLDHAAALVERLADVLPTAAPPGGAARAGLAHGWSGPAMLFTRLHAHTGDRAWLDLAERALDRDLAECGTTPDGTIQVRDGTRTLPYLAVGSAGIALAITELASHRPDAAPVAQLPGLVRACRSAFTIQPGLGLGRAGLVLTLAAVRAVRPDLVDEDAIDTHLAELAWHAVPHGPGLAFPGAELRRLSMDLDTGAAGVLLALQAGLAHHPRLLPYPPAPTDLVAAAPLSPAHDRGR